MVARELLHESGSVFVQISDDNLHHVRELLDEVFGPQNFVAVITVQKTTSATVNYLPSTCDYVIWYGRDVTRLKYRPFYLRKQLGGDGATNYNRVLLPDGVRRALAKAEVTDPTLLPPGSKIYSLDNLTSQSMGREKGEGAACWFPVEINGRAYRPGAQARWKTNEQGMSRLQAAGRLEATDSRVGYVRFFDDFPLYPLDNNWSDVGASFMADKLYVVQTSPKIIQRCMLMCSEPGDLIFDPTCGSGTTAYVAEQWGRRWITCDTSRVPLALARQRLLTATFPFYELKDPQRGPAGGFVYKRRQNRKGEEVGGLVPHITLKSIANDEPPAMEVLVDRPEVNDKVTRVAGPFVVEATIAPAQIVELDGHAPSGSETQSLDAALGDADAANGGLPLQVAEPAGRYADPATHIERMTQVLRQSKTLRLPGNRELVLADIRRMTDSDAIHAEGLDAEGNRIAVVFGPEDGAISSDVVFEAAREAYFLKFPHLYFFGFAIQAKARELLEDRAKLRVPCTYVTVTPDVAMSDLLKTSRASEIFSVTGLPDAVARKTGNKNDDGADLWEVELRGLDIFNPATMDQEDIPAQNLPAWMLDTDYDGMCFYATQVFFPKTAAWDNLQKSLKAEFDPSVWEHLAGTVSEPFPIGPKRRVAVKVIDERGNELMRVLGV